MGHPTVVREAPRDSGTTIDLLRLRRGTVERAADLVAVEEPLEIRLNGWRWMVTMRTPGDDGDLIVGLLASEGAIGSAAEVETILFRRHPDAPELANVADVTLTRALGELQTRLTRHQSLASSSCGLCGASAIAAILADYPPLPPGPRVASSVLARLPERLAEAQPVFHATGGLHAAALFDGEGVLLAAREDIGRHNATDKVLGWRLRAAEDEASGSGETGETASGRGVRESVASILLVSGRASFEIVQKALAARIPIVAAVSAPSSLAVALARDAGLTLAGFVRDGQLNIYADRDRIVTETGASIVAEATPRMSGPTATDPLDEDADALEFIPRGVRTALDTVARKISLADWQALTLPERRHLVALAESAGAAEFARYLDERVSARTGRAPRPLPAATKTP
jgi:FdhD protein